VGELWVFFEQAPLDLGQDALLVLGQGHDSAPSGTWPLVTNASVPGPEGPNNNRPPRGQRNFCRHAWLGLLNWLRGGGWRGGRRRPVVRRNW
jgi:hypothetical protein